MLKALRAALAAMRRLLGSRKVQIAIVSTLTSGIVWVGGVVGLEISPEVAGPLAGAVVVFGLTLIGAIAHEDGKAKAAGMAPRAPAEPGGPTVVATSTPAVATLETFAEPVKLEPPASP